MLHWPGRSTEAESMAETFTITGHTTSLQIKSSWRDLLRLHFELFLTTQGSVQGFFEGSFAFDESVCARLLSLKGSNHGRMTISAPDGSTVAVSFRGEARARAVQGVWHVESGTGSYVDLKGKGTFRGDAALRFTASL
jgi:hypothetical protein